MRETRILMGMPITVEIVDGPAESIVEDVFGYFEAVDRRFSPYRPDSEISWMNSEGRSEVSSQMREVLAIGDRARVQTLGYFDVRRADGVIDPSGVVKGWATRNAARIIEQAGVENYCVDAGGDIQSRGVAEDGVAWRIGVRNPFDLCEIVKLVRPCGRGVATSGNYVRGNHIYDPHCPGRAIEGIASLTVIGVDVLVADLFATACFAMGKDGIYFLEEQAELEGYAIGTDGVATQTSGFKKFVVS